MANIMSNCKVLWNYLKIVEPVRKADCIIAFGSHDEHVAVKAAELFLEGYADTVLFTGGRGKITEKIWNESEAVRFGKIAISMGVPSNKIICETRSSNTVENIENTKELLRNMNRDFRSFIIVDKPYKTFRTKLMTQNQWPDVSFCIASEDISCEEYLHRYENAPQGVGPGDVANLMTGEVSRLKGLMWKGLIEPGSIPDDVEDAFKQLCRAGFDKCNV